MRSADPDSQERGLVGAHTRGTPEHFKEQSHHTKIGLEHFPTLARRLHHCRDLSEDEPFDFITWFEYMPSDELKFNKLLAALRSIPEWKYVDREVDIRFERE